VAGCARDLEIRGRDLAWLGLRGHDRLDGQAQSGAERHVVAMTFGQNGGDRLGRTSHHDDAVLLGHAAVVGQAVELVLGARHAHLGHGDLHLERFLSPAGEDRAEDLGVGVGEGPAGDVTTVVGVSAQIRHPDPRDP